MAVCRISSHPRYQFGGVRLDDHQVDVGTVGPVAAGAGAEEDDALNVGGVAQGFGDVQGPGVRGDAGVS